VSNCRDTLAFLDSVRTRNVTTTFPANDFASLQQLGLVQFLTNDQVATTKQEVEALGTARDAILRDGAEHARLAAEIDHDSRKTRSILFHFESQQHQAADKDQESQAEAQLHAIDADMQAREQTFAQLSAKRSMLDALSPYTGGYVALTGLGAMAVRDLGVAMYRAQDDEFATYWAQAQTVNGELDDLCNQSAGYMSGLAGPLATVDRSYLWAISIGLAKSPGDPPAKVPNFLSAYQALAPLASNAENRLMSAEILSGSSQSAADNVQILRGLDTTVRKLGVPKESSLGVASILLLGRRADGTFADANLQQSLRLTQSYESAALLAVVNKPMADLQAKFLATRQIFQGWGYEPSEDVELSSAYLTVSDLPIEGVGTKLGIIARGLGVYLQYPLVGASILASIPVLEANETLSYLEKAYETLGRRTGPLAQSELICLAIRLLHGIQVASVSELDATAAARAAAARGAFYGGPRFLFVPLIVAHGYYFGTYSGIGGFHPGHVHGGGFSG
jgi:hypothetical protein